MKTIIVIMMVCLSAGLFAEAVPEVDSASAAFIDELTKTVQQGKDVIGEYAPLGIEGLVKAKGAYFKTVFPIVPAVAILGLVAAIVGVCFILKGGWRDSNYTSEWGMFVFVVGILVLLWFGIWATYSLFAMRMFEAAPEVYVIRQLIGK